MFSFFSTTGLLENCDVFCQQNLLNFRPSCFSIGFLAKTLCVLQNKLARIPLIQASWQIFGVFCKRNSGKKSWKTMEIYHGRCFSKLFSLLASCLIQLSGSYRTEIIWPVLNISACILIKLKNTYWS